MPHTTVPQTVPPPLICDNKFAYNTDKKEMTGCVKIYEQNCTDGCGSGYDTNGKPLASTGIGPLCSNGTCPSCNDPTYYNIINGSNCNTNLQRCQECLKEDNIEWKNPEAKYRSNYTESFDNVEYHYYGPNLLNADIACQNTDNFCSENKSQCFSKLKEKADDEIKNASNIDCSNNKILQKIEDGNYIIPECKYDGVPVKAVDQWLKEYLDNDQYCNPKNEDWICTRNLPEYCKGEDDCTYDGTRCVCKSPHVLLNNGKCGTPTCPGNTVPGTCPEGTEPEIEAYFGNPYPICECKETGKTCEGEYVDTCDSEMKDCDNKYSQNITDDKYHMCKKGTIFGCQAGGETCSKPM